VFRVDAVMVQRVTYSIVDRPDGRFDLVVRLGFTSLYSREGLMTLSEVEEETEFLRSLMAACGAPLVWSSTSGGAFQVGNGAVF
jgi:hypothetical protein